MTRQSGAMLLEALIGILIFAIGTLAVVGLQATALASGSDARNRAEASQLANAVISRMWATSAAGLASFQHHPDGQPCAPSGAASTNAALTDASNGWLTQVAAKLPGAGEALQQIKVVTTAGPDPLNLPDNVVTVALCWIGPPDNRPHKFVTVAHVNR